MDNLPGHQFIFVDWTLGQFCAKIWTLLSHETRLPVLFILFYFIIFYFILFYFILFYFILFYFILLYFTLFYFIFVLANIHQSLPPCLDNCRASMHSNIGCRWDVGQDMGYWVHWGQAACSLLLFYCFCIDFFRGFTVFTLSVFDFLARLQSTAFKQAEIWFFFKSIMAFYCCNCFKMS